MNISAHTKLKDAPTWLARRESPEGARDSLVPPSLLGQGSLAIVSWVTGSWVELKEMGP